MYGAVEGDRARHAARRQYLSCRPSAPRLMGVHVLGVSASPRANGGTSVLVQAALLGAHEVAETTTEYVTLAGKTVHPCDGCTACLRAGRCVLEDDMQPLYEK